MTVVVVALVIAVGLVGILVPILPGSLLVVGALVTWGVLTGGAPAWTFVAAAVVVVLVGGVVKYVVPGRRLEVVGVPPSTQWLGALGGVVGFFVIPVVGVLVGFVAGIYLAEVRRVGARAAWASTVHALEAVGLGVLIELAAALAATALWTVAVVVT